MKHRFLRAALLATSVLLPAFHAQAQPAHSGRWITESGNLEVEIAPCGPTLCGTVVRVLGNRSMSMPGSNLEPAAAEAALGLKLLTGLRTSGDGPFSVDIDRSEDLTTLDGTIYNRENGKTYGVRLTTDGPEQLLVRAYIGLPLFGKTQHWHRVGAQEAMR